MRFVLSTLALGGLCLVQSATAGLIDTRVDATLGGSATNGTIAADEYGPGNAYSYAGGGTGFGGPLGNGTVYLNSDASKLYLGANINGTLGSNLITVYLDTRTGGFDDSTMSDISDGGRHVVSDLTRDHNDVFPFQADFAIQFGNGYTNVFELGGSSHTYLNSVGAAGVVTAGTGGNSGAGGREVEINLSTLGVSAGDNVDFFATLISDSRFSSNEGVPNPGFGANPGFGSAEVTWANFNRFTVVPEPASLALLGFGAMGLMRRRK